MVTPRFTKRKYGSGHAYALNEKKIPGVTTVLRTLAKPGLINWSASEAAKFAVDHWAELNGMAPTERLDLIQRAHRNTNRDAMTRGTRIHTFGWQLAAGWKVDVPEELAEPVNAYAKFLDTWELSPIETELPVCNTQYRYGGTLDAIMTAPKLGNVLMDIKTGKGVFPETALQLAAYRYADLALYPDATTAPVHPVDACYVAHVHGDSVELLPVDAGEPVWRVFLYLLTVHLWAAGDDTPIGRALFPEELTA